MQNAETSVGPTGDPVEVMKRIKRFFFEAGDWFFKPGMV